jgi:hypothetical protein
LLRKKLLLIQTADVEARKLVITSPPSKQVIGRPRMPGSMFMI